MSSIEALERYSCRDNVVMSGIPFNGTKGYAIEVTLKACSVVGVRLEERSKSGDKPFIIKFISRFKKEAVLQGARKLKPNASLFRGDTLRKVFHNEHLTKLAATIYKQATYF